MRHVHLEMLFRNAIHITIVIYLDEIKLIFYVHFDKNG